jgi:signal transduction histidine kinase
MRRRHRSVSKRILLLVLVPMLSLFGLYVFTTTLAGRDVISLDRAKALKDATSAPVGNFLGQLDTERLFAAMYLAAPSPAAQARLQAEEARTDRTAAALRAALTSGRTVSNASAAERQANRALLADVASLPGLRSRIASRAVTKTGALAAYNAVVADAFLLLNRVILQEPSAPVVAQGLALERMGRSEELLQQENAVLTADLLGRSFPATDAHQFTELVGARWTMYGQTLADLDPSYRFFYAHDVNPQASAALTSLESAVINSPPGHLPAISPAGWQRAMEGVAVGLDHAGAQAAAALNQQAVSDSKLTELRLGLAGGIGLLAVIASIVVSLLVGRGLVRELTRLSQAAHDLADRRLPEVVRRLAAGQHVELPAGALDIPVKSDEVREVRDAFTKVGQTAVEAAVAQATLREGMSEVFRKLARRSQSLLHRQLTLLDSMERRARDPHLLEDLFRADHLTTRMRRNAENLIILSGHEPARGWRHPVPMVDVLRGAVAEVEDYTRMKVVCSAGAALAGRAVGDVIHMLAELAENATAFSPPNTPVGMTGDAVGQGFVVEIEDRGLGMTDEKLDEVNGRLANPPSFDLSTADQLGLFVAGQLAKRHDIRIHLRPNPYGGSTAIVLIPRTLVVPDEAPVNGARPEEPGAVPQGRHASPLGNGAPAGEEALMLEPLPPETGRPYVEGPGAGLPGGGLPAGELPAGELPAGELPARAEQAALADLAGQGLPDLPRRVRQASLADQLRNGAPLSAPPPEEMPGTRSPEQARSTMAAMQHGWERGRSVFDPAPPPDTGPPPDWGGTSPGAAGPGSAGPGGAGPGGASPAGGGQPPAAPEEGGRPREGF